MDVAARLDRRRARARRARRGTGAASRRGSRAPRRAASRRSGTRAASTARSARRTRARRSRVLAVDVDRGAPRRVVALGEERLGVRVQVVALGAEVVVDDVEEHAEAARVRRVDERLELVGRAVRALRRERQHAVVAPVARAGRLRERHQLDRGDAERGELVEPLRGRGVGALRRERADVQLVEHDLVPRPPAPAGSRHAYARGSITSLGACTPSG